MMLVITRKIREEILIGENIRIVVTEAKSGRVKLAIEAPREQKIKRAELDVDIKKAA